MALAAPFIVEELSVCSQQVRLSGQLRGSRVDILIDGIPDPVGGGIADWPDQWFGLTPGNALKPGQVVRARQSLDGDVSAPSSVGAVVQDRSTASPQFVASPVMCSDIAVLTALAPGATATITDSGGTVLGSATAAGTEAVVHLSRGVVNAEVLTATTSACGAMPSAPVSSLPAEPMRTTPDVHLLALSLTEPVYPCMRVLHFTGTQIGAMLLVGRQGTVTSWQVTGTELLPRIDPPLKDGERLTYWQEEPSPRCQVGPSARIDATVQAGPPPPPWVLGPVCPSSRIIHVYGLIPTATVKILSGGAELLRFEAAAECQDVDLAGVTLTSGQQLTIEQGLCDVFGGQSSAITVTAPVPNAAPSMPERLVACAGVVRVAGLAEGTFVQVYSERLKGRIGYAWSGEGAVDVLVSPPLLPPGSDGKKDHIRAEVTGCAGGTVEREVDPPADIPPFWVEAPHQDDRSVHVLGLVPGCLVDVFVEGHWANEVWAAGADVRVPVSPALQQGWHIDATARLCSQHRSAQTVTVGPPVHIQWERPTGSGMNVYKDHYVAGRVMAVLTLGPDFDNVILAGTEEGGLWTLQTGGSAFPLSMDWPTPSIRALAHGTRGSGHLYCGTTNGMLETDPTVLLPLLSWAPVNGLPGSGAAPTPGGSIWDILVLAGHNLVVVATEGGVWWSPIPPTSAAGYAWTSDPAVNQEQFSALCEGPGESIIAYRMGAPRGGFFVGTWGASGLHWTETTPGVAGPPSDPRLTTVAAQMANGSLASRSADRTAIYAALSDTKDDQWLAVLRFDWSSQTWSIPYTDPTLTYFKAIMGDDAGRCLRVGVHPTNGDNVLLASRRTGVLGSTNGGKSWDTGRWPDLSQSADSSIAASFHGDNMCLIFDPTDPSGNTVVVGSDGGLFVSRDLAVSWDTSHNATFPTLMFDGPVQPTGQALSASPGYPGVLIGAFQDNSTAYLATDGEVWQNLGDGGDGNRALFVTSDVALHSGNDNAGLRWSQWDGTKFVNTTATAPAAAVPKGSADNPAGQGFLPNLARVTYPNFSDPSTGTVMVAVAGGSGSSGNVYGLFDNGPGANPPGTRLYWKSLGTLPQRVTGVASLTGRLVLVGTDNGHLYGLDTATTIPVEYSLPAGLDTVAIRRIVAATSTLAFCLAGNAFLRTTNRVSWSGVAGPATPILDALDVDRGLDPVGLIVAGSDGAWLSRDLGDTWQPTAGLPKHPHANHLEVVDYGAPGRAVHLGTWNWSVWRASLT